jgi:hypothetical protein
MVAVLGTLPASGGALTLGPSVTLALTAGGGAPRCEGGPGSWCATLERSADAGWASSAALPACGTSAIMAPIGGCGDPVVVPITAGETACGDRIELGLVWPAIDLLCH